MADRFTKLYASETIPYIQDMPVLLMAGSLLRDAYSGELITQLRLHSLSIKPIKAITVLIQMLDISGEELEPEVRHQYLDLNLVQDDEIGRETAIILPRRDARSFRATVEDVIFEDNSRWHSEPDTVWEQLPKLQKLEEAYGDEQIAEQFRIAFGPDCRYLPAAESDLWFCTCGAVNRVSEDHCHRCRRVCSALLSVNTDSLRQEASSRLVLEEQRIAEEQAGARERHKKWLKAAVIILPLLILAAGLLKVMPGYLQQRRDYRNAESLLAMGYYEQAADAFSALGNYRDSAEQGEKNVPYQRALHLLASADADDASALRLIGRSRADLSEQVTAAMLLYRAAAEEFEALDGYRDCADCIIRCQKGIQEQEHAVLQRAYDAAMQLLEEQNYSQARLQFLALENFENSVDMAREAVYRKAHGLYHYICRYDVRQVYADLSISPDRGSSFVIPKDAALSMGSQCVTDLYEACGNDPVDVNLSDEHGQSMKPLAACVTELFEDLDGYRDSADCLAGIRDATDYTKDFFMLCETGDLNGAMEWLNSYEGEFSDRDVWKARLQLYLPFCTSWSLYSGDATVIPLTVGRGNRCTSCSTRVLFRDSSPVLRLSANDGEEYYFDLYAEPDDVFFANYDNPAYRYILVINNVGRMSYIKYDTDGNLITSCEYTGS